MFIMRGKCVVSGQILKDKILGETRNTIRHEIRTIRKIIFQNNIWNEEKGGGIKKKKNLIKQEVTEIYKN